MYRKVNYQFNNNFHNQVMLEFVISIGRILILAHLLETWVSEPQFILELHKMEQLEKEKYIPSVRNY